MDDLKRARERRAASARNAREDTTEYGGAFREQFEEWRGEQDDRPFWERDDPFEMDGYTPRKASGEAERAVSAHRVKSEQYEEERPMRNSKSTQRAQENVRNRRQDGGAGRGGERRTNTAGQRRKPAYDERREGPAQGKRQGRSAPERKSRAGLYMLMLLLGLLALAVIIGLKVFEIARIDVKGNDTMSAESIITLSGISKGENIFKVNLGQARRNLETDPLVEVLGISRIFPDRIKIDIRQRKPHGAIAYLGNYVIIDEKGFVLDERTDLPIGQFPLITGIDIEPSQKGKPLAGVDDARLQTMYKLLKALYDRQAMPFISEANLSQADDIRLLTADGLQISVGKASDLERKAEWIACTVPELRKNGYTTGVLYVTGTGSPVYSGSGAGGQSEGSSGGQEQDGAASGQDQESEGDGGSEGPGSEGGDDSQGSEPSNAA